MDSLFIFYFFILLIFLKSINIDYRLILFIIIITIFYNYHYSKIENINEKLEDSLKKTNVYSYGNKIKVMEKLNEQNIRKIRTIKDKIYSMNIHRNDKIEIYSSVKKYFHIYGNYNNYDYKHNWINDLYEFEKSIFNKISSLNISYEDLEKEIEDLFNEVEGLINNIKSKFDNYHVYNNINHPSGYEKNNQNSYIF